MHLKSIYIIDDDEIDQFVIMRNVRKICKDMNMEVFFSAESFFKFLEESHTGPDPLQNILVTLDLRMPGMGGLKALEKLQSLKDAGSLDSIFLVVLTSSDSEKDKSSVGMYPFVHQYVTKPMTVDVFRNILK